ncbi:MAG TPA: polymer-forming cytoskeletal protein [Polyangiaceae bacterium]|nr:polymer-forming cytoskeletal protein [Polyangiaceae bacterium]
MMSTTGKKTLVEEGTHFKGSLSSNCPIEVKGHIEGDIAAPALSVSASGAVHGRVKVGEIRSEGELAGEFDADVVQLSGSVKDNTVIRAKSLEVKLAPPSGKMQVIFGECELEVGSERAADAPKARASVAPPKNGSIPPVADTNGSS